MQDDEQMESFGQYLPFKSNMPDCLVPSAVMSCRYVLFLSPARSDELEKWDANRGCNQMSPL